MNPDEKLHRYVLNILQDRYPDTVPTAGQTLKFDFQVDFGIDVKHPEKKAVLVEVKRHRASVEDIIRLHFYRTIVDKKKLDIILFAPVFNYKVKQLAKEVGIELISIPKELSRDFGSEKGRKRKVKISSPNAWKVVLYFIRNERSSINEAAQATGTSYSWANAVVHHLISLGLIERKGRGLFILLDVNKLLNGISWERPLKELVKKEWTVESRSIDDVLRDIVDVDPAAILTGYLAVPNYFDLGRRVDLVQIYSKKPLDLELQLGRSDDGIRVSILEPDRKIGSLEASRLGVKGLNVVDPDQLILDMAGLGYAASDVLMEILGEEQNEVR